MKTTSFTLLITLLLHACSTQKLIRHEEGELIRSKARLTTTKLPTEFNINFAKVFKSGKEQLVVEVFRNDPIKEEWEDTYKKVGVYEQQCRGWRGEYEPFTTPPRVKRSDDEYCTIPTLSFTLYHIFLVGFLYDIFIPFESFNERVITSTKVESDSIKKWDSAVVNNKAVIDSPKIQLTINSKSVTASKSEDKRYYFDFSTLSLNPNDLPNFPEVSLHFDSRNQNAQTEFANFVAKDREERTAQKAAFEREKNWPENKYKKKFCKQPDLFNAIYDPFEGKIESDCLYVLRGPLKVIQATNGGILVGLMELSQHMPNKTFFLKTNKLFVDDDHISPMFVHSTGPLNYNTVLGANRTVHSFKYLGEAKIKRSNSYNEDYNLDPDQD